LGVPGFVTLVELTAFENLFIYEVAKENDHLIILTFIHSQLRLEGVGFRGSTDGNGNDVVLVAAISTLM
jgi:hypothetical protein